MIKKSAYTLLELLIVVVIFTGIFGLTLSLVYYSNQSWRIGRLKQETQQEARKALDSIILNLRESAPVWHVDGNDYQIEINAAGDAMKFYVPIVDAAGTIISLEEVRFYCGGRDNKQLLKIEGENQAIALTDAVVNNVPTLKPFFSFLNGNTDTILITIPIVINNETFQLSSNITLRNRESTLAAVPVEEVPGEEGEF